MASPPGDPGRHCDDRAIHHGNGSRWIPIRPKTISAVERKLSIISEAAIRLGDQAEALCPGLSWRNIRGIGNWLRHQYDRVDIETIWRTAADDLPAMETAVTKALAARRK